MPTSTFEFDKTSIKLLKSLQKKFNLDSEEAVLKRALFVLDGISAYKSSDDYIIMQNPDDVWSKRTMVKVAE